MALFEGEYMKKAKVVALTLSIDSKISQGRLLSLQTEFVIFLVKENIPF